MWSASGERCWPILGINCAHGNYSIKGRGREILCLPGVSAGSHQHASARNSIADHIFMWPWIAIAERRFSGSKAEIQDMRAQINSVLQTVVDVGNRANA